MQHVYRIPTYIIKYVYLIRVRYNNKILNPKYTYYYLLVMKFNLLSLWPIVIIIIIAIPNS